MNTTFSPIINRRFCAITAIGTILFASLGTATAIAKAPDAAPAEEPAEKPAEKAVEKPVETPAEKPKPIMQLANGSVMLTARTATIHGTKLRYEREKNTLGYWFNADDWVSWEFEITKPQKLFVDLRQSCGPDSGGSHYTVEVAGQTFKDKVQETDSFRIFRVRRLGTLQIEKPGIYRLSLRVQDKPRLAVMDLRDITLLPPELEKPIKSPPLVKLPAKPPAQSPAKDPPAAGPTETPKP